MTYMFKSTRWVLSVSALCALIACGEREQSGERETFPQSNTTTAQADQSVTPAPKTDSTRALSQQLQQKASKTDPSQPSRDRLVEDPDYLTLYRVFLAWSEEEIPVEEWADRSVGSIGQHYNDTLVSEFNRSDLVAREKERIESWLENTEDVGTLVFNVRGRLSEYDSHYNEFYIDTFSPGSGVTFSPERRDIIPSRREPPNIRMYFTNGTDIYAWEISQENAVRVIDSLGERNRGDRSVTARVVAEIVSVAGSAGSAPRFDIKILSYDLHDLSGRPLARYTTEKGITLNL